MNAQMSEVFEVSKVSEMFKLFEPGPDALSATLPNQDALRRLALSDSGFVFDPVNGDSYTVNASGLAVIRLLKDGQSFQQVLLRVTQEFDVDSRRAERDISDFINQLRKYFG